MHRLLDAEQQEPHGHQSRHDGHPEDGSEIIGPEQHQADGEQRAEHCADRIERLPQAEGGTPKVWWGDVRDQGVPWCATHPFSDSVQQASGQDEAHPRGYRKERLGKGPQGVAEYSEPLPLTPIVAQRS